MQTAASCKSKGAPEVDVHGVDLSQPSQVRKFADDVLHKYKNVDVLVNNAGMGPSSGGGPVKGKDDTNDKRQQQQYHKSRVRGKKCICHYLHCNIHWQCTIQLASKYGHWQICQDLLGLPSLAAAVTDQLLLFVALCCAA